MNVSQPLAGLPSQLPKLALHEPKLHVLETQRALAFAKVQRWLHIPQLLLSLRVSTSQPFVALPSQFTKPALQAPRPQTLEAHTALAFAGVGQALLQRLQWARLVRVSTHMPSQRVSVGAQSVPHIPREQTWPVEHGLSQRPQWVRLDCRSTQAPVTAGQRVCGRRVVRP